MDRHGEIHMLVGFTLDGEHTRPRVLSLAPSPKTGRPSHSTRLATTSMTRVSISSPISRLYRIDKPLTIGAMPDAGSRNPV
jgi:hypothetical protein